MGRLRGEVENARDVGNGGADDGADRAGRGGAGGGLAVAGPGDVSGEELPEAMPEDFPIPAGAVDYVSEMGYNFSLNFVIESGFETTAGFCDEQLAAQGWEETDRTEGTVEGLKGAETS